MAKDLYKSGNYVIVVNGDGYMRDFPSGKTVITETVDSFKIIEGEIEGSAIEIPFTDIPNWINELAVPYTEASLRTFLRENTGNFSSGGVSTFEGLTDTPLYAGNANKGLRINAHETGLEAVVLSDLNQWLVTGVAFVDPVNGDNGTGVVGDGNLPFKWIQNALAVADKVILLAGNYPFYVNVTTDNKQIHAMAGVNFVSGGLRVIGTGVNNFSFTGLAIFTGSSRSLDVQNSNATIHFECDSIDNRMVLWTGGNTYSPKITFECNWIRCSAYNGAAYCVRLVGGSEITMNIKFYFHAQHANYHVRNGTTGRLIVNCPDSQIIPNYTSNFGNAAKKVLWADSVNGAYIEINGDLYANTGGAYAGAGVGNCISIENWSNSNPSTLIINGNIRSIDSIPLFSQYRSAFGNIQINGNVISDRNSLFDELTGWGAVADQYWTFNGSICDAFYHWLVGRGKTFSFKDCTFLIREDGTLPNAGKIFTGLEPGSPASQTYLYFYNCAMQSNDTTLETFNMSANFHLATINTYSNLPIGTGVVDDWAGFTEIPSLITPKIK